MTWTRARRAASWRPQHAARTLPLLASLGVPAGIARRLIIARSLRGFADGFVSVLLAIYLYALGLSPLEIGAVVTATLLGSAALTLAVGLVAQRLPARSILLGASALMGATGLGFAWAGEFWPLIVIAFAGTLNPSAGDVSVFLPTEQAALADAVPTAGRTAVFARYNLGGALLGALGAGLSGAPDLLARSFALDPLQAMRGGFLAYGAVAIAVAAVYHGLPRSQPAASTAGRSAPLARSRRTVLQLASLFSVDAFGGGFVVQSLLVLWLFQRFGLSPALAGGIFLAAGLLSAGSQLGSSWLAERIGLIRTMVYTHLPANLFLIAAAFAPSAGGAVGFLLLRAALSQMDVPARQAFVMAIVPPEERAAAASVTNVPRSLAAALSPLLAGALLAQSSFGWPLVAAGVLKIVYDLALFASFARVRTG